MLHANSPFQRVFPADLSFEELGIVLLCVYVYMCK